MTSLADLPLRDDLRGKQPYGAPQLHVPVEINVNENTFGIPDDVAADIISAVAAAVKGMNRYPDREFVQLREALAGYVGHGVTVDHVWAANGSNEVLQQILQAFGGPGRTLMSFPPTYSMYPLLADGTQTRYVAGTRSTDYTLDPAITAAQVAAENPDLVVICSPNNPTGTAIDLETIERVYDATQGIVIVDEAYHEFGGPDAPTAIDLLPGRPRLLVSRTMSKAFAFAGARLGYLIADPAVADALRLVRLPYHLSALTQAAATAALGHADRMLENVDAICRQRDRMITGLTELGYQPYPSAANFVFFAAVASPETVFNTLLQHGVLIRNMGIPHTLRVTAGTEWETGRFLEEMAALGPGAVQADEQ
ncbi:MAG TPA: histidinol-phosphate transaminase [Pseudoclavibacter sp.]|nr:histidinol-phosphate transaminase [Pseudoclavibacter sp.]